MKMKILKSLIIKVRLLCGTKNHILDSENEITVRNKESGGGGLCLDEWETGRTVPLESFNAENAEIL